MRAAATGHVELMTPLICGGADPNNESVSGHTPLHCAVLGDHAAAVSKLIEMGAKAGGY